jgi:acetoacetyl-CoA synthetase
MTDWNELMAMDTEPLSFEAVPFDHPIWILYSSGTTGKPKAITHSTGGCLIEHLKALVLHQDVRPGDRYFWYSTTGWMMWNYAVGSLLAGATLLLYDGAPAHPDMKALWSFAQEAGIHHFGSGAAFYISCMKAGLTFGPEALPLLRTVGSTGSPLPAEAFRWIYDSVKRDVWLVSISGGTDVCSAFVGGCPLLPVHAGEIQCRLLGCDLESFDETGQPVRDSVGEMVIRQPMPSMPIRFWNDTGDERYRASYFESFPGVWRHGDWIEITDDGSIVISGRSDATLNRDGVRIGTSEVYGVVESLPEVADSLVVCIERKDGSFHMPLFVVMRESFELDDPLKERIKRELRARCSPRHVPDAIHSVSEVPYTISGKKMETPVKKILMGIEPSKAASLDTMRNPHSLAQYMRFAAVQ